MIQYRGYIGIIKYNPERDEIAGRVVNLTRDRVTFAGRSVDELKRAMAASVDTYLARCEQQGVEPERPFSGSLTVRIPPELHRAIALVARQEGQSLNSWIGDTLERAVAQSLEGDGHGG